VVSHERQTNIMDDIAAPATLNTCLYCKRAGRPSSGNEHIFPESLGNQELTLPKGTVCDTCNNGILAWLDNALVNFEPIIFMRTLFAIPSKAGKVPTASFADMKMVRKAGNRVSLHLQGRGKGFRPRPAGFRLGFHGHRYTLKRRRALIRSFYKIGLGLIHYDHGAKTSMSTMFDSVRSIILGTQIDFSGFLAFSREVKPELRCYAQYKFVPTTRGVMTPFEVTIFGVHFLFDLQQHGLDNPEILRDHGFIVLNSES
jgi:hypothetical protein